MQDEWAGIVVHGTNSFSPELFAGAGCGMCACYLLRVDAARQDDDRRSAWRESSCAPWQASQALRSAGSGITPCVVSRVAGAVSAIWLGLWSGCVEVGAVRSRA